LNQEQHGSRLSGKSTQEPPGRCRLLLRLHWVGGSISILLGWCGFAWLVSAAALREGGSRPQAYTML